MRVAACILALVCARGAWADERPVLEYGWRSDLLDLTEGGVKPGFEHVGQLDLAVAGALRGFGERPLRWRASAFWNDGGAFAARVGDLQVVSNIETADEGVRSNEIWIEQAFAWRDASLLIGKYDVNSEFDVLPSAVPFVNSAFGIGTDIGQSGRNGPSIFPATAAGVRLQFDVRPDVRARIALLDGVPGGPERERVAISARDGALLVTELAWQRGEQTVLAGYWRYSGRFESQCAPLPGCADDRGNDGFYLRGEARLGGRDGDATLHGFVRLGRAASAFNAFERFKSAGVLLRRWLPGRPDDVLGIGFAWGDSAPERRRALIDRGEQPSSGEIAWELTWRAPVGRGLTLQPTLQYVRDPGARASVDDAWIAGLRIEFAGASAF